jgi:uncharacterized protein YhbP (UPF0306 family)
MGGGARGMAIERTTRFFPSGRLATAARRLLEASTLCAIATVSPRGRSHVNTAYFAWARDFDLVWLSAPEAAHSRNLGVNPSVAIAVYDSAQTWGNPDRGIQLFGSAREDAGAGAEEAERTYARRFPAFVRDEHADYRFYRFRPRRVKLFDETALGAGVFVTAAVGGGGRLSWQRTEIYRGTS